MASTIVSFARREVFETIPGMMCAFYRIPPAEGNTPNLLIVEDSHYHKPDIDGNQDAVHVASAQIANSVVEMHIRSQLGYKPEFAYPALFAIPNREVTAAEVFKDYLNQVKKAQEAQKQWFIELVRMADDDWTLAHRHQMVSDIQRTAARELGLRREWLDAVPGIDVAACNFCGSGLLNPDAPICPTCRNIHNPEKYAELMKMQEKFLKPVVPSVEKK